MVVSTSVTERERMGSEEGEKRKACANEFDKLTLAASCSGNK